MQPDLITHLRCPICHSALEMEIIERGGEGIQTAILHSSCGMLYPVVAGVPRLLLESFLDYEDILKTNYRDFTAKKEELLFRYGHLVLPAKERNRRSKGSFSLEWGLLENRDQLRVWNTEAAEYKRQLFAEIDLDEQDLAGKKVIDVGCGHGRATQLLAQTAALVIGMDLGNSVVNASRNNKATNCQFIQADLQFPPFSDSYFDLVYSSGVLHHTENTKHSFTVISHLTGKNGVLSVWLYQPYDNFIQHILLFLRKFTVNMPLKLQYWLYLLVLTPVHWVVSFLKGNRPHWREIMISQLDMLSPQFRHEHKPGEVEEWYRQNRFDRVTITTTNAIGFSMKGQKLP